MLREAVAVAAAADPIPEADSPRRLHHAARRAVLATRAAIFLAAAAAAIVVLGPLTEYAGWQLVPELTGEMSPVISPGSLMIHRNVPAAILSVGDIVSFTDSAHPTSPVTRRIRGLTKRDGGLVINTATETPGAAVAVKRSWSVPVDQPVGRVTVVLPYLGYVLAAVATPLARLLIMLAAVFLIFARPKRVLTQ